MIDRKAYAKLMALNSVHISDIARPAPIDEDPWIDESFLASLAAQEKLSGARLTMRTSVGDGDVNWYALLISILEGVHSQVSLDAMGIAPPSPNRRRRCRHE